jgi:hypothetical protein
MGKKMDQGEQKKECPSCGLGVALEATICEFCGWDFEEEDEWILQIEKLERELMLEKRKFEPGTVNHRIESTLRNPVLERIEMAQAEAAAAEEAAPMPEKQRIPPPPPTRELKKPEPAPPAPRRFEPAPQQAEKKAPPMPEFEPEPPSQNVRRVRTVKTPPAPPAHHEHAPAHHAKPAHAPEPAPAPAPTRVLKQAPPPEAEPDGPKKTRVVRKVRS